MDGQRPLMARTADSTTVTLDDVDKRIIAELQVDGRMPFSTLAPLVGLSDAATRQRVNRLIEREVIAVVAITDALALGFAFQALVGVDIAGDPAEVAAALKPVDEVTYLVIVAGRHNLLVELVCVDAEHLLELTTMISELPSVTGTEVMTFLRMVKVKYDWGAR